MAVLSDGEIREAFEDGQIGIDPAPDWDEQLQPASLDLRLGRSFRVYRALAPGQTPPVIDLKEGPPSEFTRGLVLKDGERFILERQQFALATTEETIAVPLGLVARVDGRSSFGRLGLMIHSTAGFIDPGFKGQVTLELMNVGAWPIALYPGTRICQVSFHRLGKPARHGYQGKYQGQMGATPSKAHLDETGRPVTEGPVSIRLDPPESPQAETLRKWRNRMHED